MVLETIALPLHQTPIDSLFYTIIPVNVKNIVAWDLIYVSRRFDGIFVADHPDYILSKFLPTYHYLHCVMEATPGIEPGYTDLQSGA